MASILIRTTTKTLLAKEYSNRPGIRKLSSNSGGTVKNLAAFAVAGAAGFGLTYALKRALVDEDTLPTDSDSIDGPGTCGCFLCFTVLISVALLFHLAF